MAPILLGPASRQRPGIAPHATPAMARLTVQGATHHFGSRAALIDVNLTIAPGEIFGLLGPNGAGKSTLMRAICGRLVLEQGNVRLDGTDPATSVDTRSKIGFVPQDIALYGYLTVRENLTTFAMLAGVPRPYIPEAIARGLARTGLTPRADDRVDTLSGGYQRRVNICASILHQPTLLVLDEPTVGVDLDARDSINRLLGDLRTRGTAILLTTHDLDQAQLLSDRVGILQGGRFILQGAPAALIRDTFGGRSELLAVLGKVDAQRSALLKTLGLQPGQTPGTWGCLAASAAIDLQSISRRLTATGVTVKELRIREPDLASLFTATLKSGGPS